MLLAVPSKGRLQEPTLKLLEAVGIKALASDERALVIPTSWPDVNIIKARPEDIPYIVESGRVWAGVTGHDYVVEAGVNVVEALDLNFGKGRLVVAVPKSSGVKSIDDLPPGARVATKFVNIAYNYFAELGKRVRVVKVTGSVEVLPQLGIADAILDVMATGTTLEVHGLTPIATVLETSARLVVHPRYVEHELTKETHHLYPGLLRRPRQEDDIPQRPRRQAQRRPSRAPRHGGPQRNPAGQRQHF